MSCVSEELRRPVHFGDWRGTRKALPDVTIWAEDQQHCTHTVAGEMKTPWTLDLGQLMSGASVAGRDEFEEEFTLWAGKFSHCRRILRA